MVTARSTHSAGPYRWVRSHQWLSSVCASPSTPNSRIAAAYGVEIRLFALCETDSRPA